MFLTVSRMSGKRSDITIIEPSHYLDFFKELRSTQMDAEFKCYLAVAVSGGCRVSEALSIKSGDISDTGRYKVKVLKKHTKKGMPKVEVHRTCQLMPEALAIVKEYIVMKGLKPEDQLFTFHRCTVHRKIKRYFGPKACAHSIARHSHFSWLLHEQEASPAAVASEMEVWTHVVDRYNHANIELEQLERFRKAA